MIDKKKILFIWSEFGLGGAEKAAINLIRKLERNYEIEVLLCYEKKELYNLESNVKVRSIVKSKISFLKPFYHAKIFINIFASFFKHDFFIIYDIPLLVFISGIIKLIFPNKKNIYWIHVCKSELQQVKSALINYFLIKFYANAYKCICVSRTCKKSFLEYMGTCYGNIDVIYNIINDYKYKNIGVHISDSFTVSALGRLSPEKNFQLLIQAISELNKEGRDIVLKIGGTGESYNVLENMIIKNKMVDKIILVGLVTNSVDFIYHSDVFVSSSQTETFSFCVIEALIAQKPVVVTKTGAVEIVENGRYGIVVEKNDKEMLKKAIVDLMDDPSKRKFFSDNAVKALEKYSNDDAVKRWSSIFQEEL